MNKDMDITEQQSILDSFSVSTIGTHIVEESSVRIKPLQIAKNIAGKLNFTVDTKGKLYIRLDWGKDYGFFARFMGLFIRGDWTPVILNYIATLPNKTKEEVEQFINVLTFCSQKLPPKIKEDFNSLNEFVLDPEEIFNTNHHNEVNHLNEPEEEL